MEPWQIYLYIVGSISVITFLFYAVDKWKAVRGAWRIPEKVLLGFSFFGGAAGGYLAMQLVRHKTRKWYFQLVNILGLILQIALLAYLFLNPNIL